MPFYINKGSKGVMYTIGMTHVSECMIEWCSESNLGVRRSFHSG